jgi:hypothetical protein
MDLGQLKADMHTALPCWTLEAEAGFFLIGLLHYWWQLQEVSTQDQLQSTKWVIISSHCTSNPLQLLYVTPYVKTLDSMRKQKS